MQIAVTQFVSACGKSRIFVENDMPIGIFHDHLMEIKGLMVEKMVEAHKQQIAMAAAQKEQDPELDPETQDCVSKE